MNIIENHIARLGIESMNMPKDGEVFTAAEQAIKTGGADTIQTIVRFANTHPNDLLNVQIDGNTATLSALQIAIGGAMGLALYGKEAKTEFQNLILSQTTNDFRNKMIRQADYLYTDWVRSALDEIVDKLDDRTARLVRNINKSPIALQSVIMIPALQHIKAWMNALDDVNQYNITVANLTHVNAFARLDNHLDQAGHVAQSAFKYINQTDNINHQIKIAQLAYRYSPNIDTWMQAFTWFEKHYMDGTITRYLRTEMFKAMNVNLDHLTYKNDALNALDQSLINFVKQNNDHKLDVAAIDILMINNLPAPPEEYRAKNKTANQDFTLKCQECGKEVTLSQVVNIPFVRAYFCSQACARSYMIREYGSMNPQNI